RTRANRTGAQAHRGGFACHLGGSVGTMSYSQPGSRLGEVAEMGAGMAPATIVKTTAARNQRNEDVRLRIEVAIGQSLRQVGRDYVLPDNRRVVICYSKFHPRNAYFYLGLPNRLQNDDILVLLLGDKHLVFPKAEAILRYKGDYPRSDGGRPIPGLQIK